MKNFYLAFFLLLTSTYALGQTAASATVVDSDSQAWIGGTWSATYSYPVSSGTPVVAGLPFTLAFSGALDGTGSFSQSLTSTSLIFPATTPPTSGWVFCVTSAVSNPKTYCTKPIAVTGGTFSASTAINAVIAAPRLTCGTPISAYADVEIANPTAGCVYYNLVSAVNRVYNGTSWANQGGGGGNATTVNGATVPASQPCLGSNGASQLVAGTCGGVSPGTTGQVPYYTSASTVGPASPAILQSATYPMPSGTQCEFLYPGASGSTWPATIGAFNTQLNTASWSPDGLTTSGSNYATFDGGCVNAAKTMMVFYTTNNSVITAYDLRYGFLYSSDTSNGVLINGNIPNQGPSLYSPLIYSGDHTTGTTAACLVLGSTGRIYLNGSSLISQPNTFTGQSFSATSTAYFGTFKGLGFNWPGTIHAIATWPTELTPSQCKAAYNSMNASMSNSSVRAVDATDYSLSVVVGDGDSIRKGLGNNFSYYSETINQAVAQLGLNSVYLNLGEPGVTLGGLVTEYPNKVAPILAKYGTGYRVVAQEAGTNDLSTGTSSSSLLSSITSYCGLVHQSLGKCVVTSIIPNSAVTGGNETNRLAYNAGLPGLVQSGTIDALDPAADNPIMGNGANTSNTSLYADGTHPTDTGAGYLVASQALGLHRAIAPQVPYWFQISINSQAFTGVASTTKTQTLVQLMPGEQVCGVKFQVSTAFSGTSITALAVTTGDSTGTTTQYLSSQSMTATTKTQASGYSFVSTNGIVQANFTATGANLSAISAGAATFQVCLVTIP